MFTRFDWDRNAMKEVNFIPVRLCILCYEVPSPFLLSPASLCSISGICGYMANGKQIHLNTGQFPFLLCYLASFQSCRLVSKDEPWYQLQHRKATAFQWQHGLGPTRLVTKLHPWCSHGQLLFVICFHNINIIHRQCQKRWLIILIQSEFIISSVNKEQTNTNSQYITGVGKAREQKQQAEIHFNRQSSHWSLPLGWEYFSQQTQPTKVKSVLHIQFKPHL